LFGTAVLSVLVAGVVFVASGLGWALFVAPNRIVVEPVEFETRGWPGGGGGELRIAFFSDLDLEGAPGRRERRLLGLIRDLDPDLVAVGGDLFGSRGTPPDDEVIRAMGGWLGEMAEGVPHGVVLVWGERDVLLADRIEAFLPAGVRVLEQAQMVVPAGQARVRICGPEGHFAPLEVRDGVLRGREGMTLTLARYGRPEAMEWTSLELSARLRFGRPGDGPGLAVLVGPDSPGLPFQILPNTAEWGLSARDPAWKGWAYQRGSLPSYQWLRVRIKVEVEPEVTRVSTRAWPEDQPEPASWSITVERRDEARPRRGTLAVVLGGRPRGTGRHEWDDLLVTGPDGKVLLQESFDDPDRFDAFWHRPCGPPQSIDATVLLLHTPATLLHLGSQPFLDLALAGHTHGGQVRLPPFGPVAVEPHLPAGWLSGMIRLDHGRQWLYVTRGIGTSGFPVRLFCPPELTDLHLRIIPRPEQ
jgi:predicted MPP superfamily phosphohydrolase